jgi:hypothetical protein
LVTAHIDNYSSVSGLAGGALFGSGIQNISGISIEGGSVNLKVSGDCIVDFNGVRLVSYFGSAPTAILSRDIEIFGSNCCYQALFSDLRFESGSKLSRIHELAFEQSFTLRSIHIPASVTTISALAFSDCHLESLHVEEGNSHFRVLGKFLLDFSGKLLIQYFGSDLPVCILRQIEVLRDCCFAYCDIAELIFESGSLIPAIGHLLSRMGQILTFITKYRAEWSFESF